MPFLSGSLVNWVHAASQVFSILSQLFAIYAECKLNMDFGELKSSKVNRKLLLRNNNFWSSKYHTIISENITPNGPHQLDIYQLRLLPFYLLHSYYSLNMRWPLSRWLWVRLFLHRTTQSPLSKIYTKVVQSCRPHRC